MDQKKSNKIYLLKGIAILGIVFVHSTQNVQDVSRIVYHISRFGQMGCQIFFMLSGLLMYNSWKKRKNYKSFVWKRISNMVPLYWLMIVIYVLLNIVFKSCIDNEKFVFSYRWLFSILGNMFFFNAIIPGLEVSVPGGWYLSTTVIFLLIFPLIIKIIDFFREKNFSIKLILMLFAIFCICVQIVVCQKFNLPITKNNSFLYFSFINQMPCLVVGILLNYEQAESTKRTLENSVFWFLLSVIFFYVEWDISYIVSPILVSISAKYLLMHLEKKKNHLIAENFLINIGKITYEIYMLQGLFVYYLPVMIRFICQKKNIYVGGTLFWFIYLVLIIFALYESGKKIHLIRGIRSYSHVQKD